MLLHSDYYGIFTCKNILHKLSVLEPSTENQNSIQKKTYVMTYHERHVDLLPKWISMREKTVEFFELLLPQII